MARKTKKVIGIKESLQANAFYEVDDYQYVIHVIASTIQGGNPSRVSKIKAIKILEALDDEFIIERKLLE